MLGYVTCESTGKIKGSVQYEIIYNLKYNSSNALTLKKGYTWKPTKISDGFGPIIKKLHMN